MNKLQGANCGCMGKLFSNPSGAEGRVIGNTQLSRDCSTAGFGGCRGGGCCNSFGGNFGLGGGEPCMGRCNPRIKFTDTHNYLNTNLMQPTIDKVQNNSKSITPEKMVLSKPMTVNVGLIPQENMQRRNALQVGNSMQEGNPSNMLGWNATLGKNVMEGRNVMRGRYPIEGGNVQAGNSNQGEYSMEGGNAQRGIPIQYNQISSRMGNQMQENFGNEMSNQGVRQIMGGMGSNIDMVNGDGNVKPMSSNHDSVHLTVDAPQSLQGNSTPIIPAGEMYSTGGRKLNNPNQQLFTPTAQYATGANMIGSRFNPNEQNYYAINMYHGQANPNMQQSKGNLNNAHGMANLTTQQDMANPNMQQDMTNPSLQQSMTHPNPSQTGRFNPASQQMAPGSHNYGQHSEGIKKFNEMFPGLISRNLGFDPMAIAIQMNPENHERAATNQINKVMSGNAGDLSNVLASTNAIPAKSAGENVSLGNRYKTPPSNHQTSYGPPASNTTRMTLNQQYNSNTNTSTPAYPNQKQVYYESDKAPQQLANTGGPASNQEEKAPSPSQQQYQYAIESNTGVPQISPAANHRAADVNAQQQGQGHTSETAPESQLMIKDPIFPADTSRPFKPPSYMRRRKVFEYNTLGQPIQLIPAKMFRNAPETELRQTLYPQPPSGKLRKYISRHNVQSTVSKTSPLDNRQVGRTLSRGILGSHSNTQQNNRNPLIQNDTYSEGKLGAQRTFMNQVLPEPVESMGGDAANNRHNDNLPPVNEHPIKQHGDVPALNKPYGDISTKAPPKIQENIGKRTNGLQDIVFTAFPTSISWSFNGNGKKAVPAGCWR